MSGGGRSKFKPFKRLIWFGLVFFIGERKRSRSNDQQQIKFDLGDRIVEWVEMNQTCHYACKMSRDMNLSSSISWEFVPLIAYVTLKPLSLIIILCE
jgi:hypothetical protein